MTPDKTKPENLIQAGDDWEADKMAMIAKSEKRAWLVALGMTLIALGSIVALVGLTPLKATVPYLIYVDKTTGNTEVVTAINEREVGYRELNEKYWARKYVISRENYLYTLLQEDYDTTLALSSDDVGRQYAKQYEGDGARDKKLGAGTEERIKILSVVLPPDQRGKAVVRYEKTVKKANADQPEPPQTYVATFAFEFKPSMKGKEAALIRNPLGYKVTSYRTDIELGVSKQ